MEAQISECVKSISRLEAEVKAAYIRLVSVYKARFPELTSIPGITHLQYAKVVLAVKDSSDVFSCCFDGILSVKDTLSLKMMAQVSKGSQLPDILLNECIDLANVIIEKQKERQALAQFVIVNMPALAPNMCALVGPEIAANMMASVGGGLGEMSRQPANNLLLIGREADRSSYGLLINAEVLTCIPPELENLYTKNGVRMLAAKLALCCRMDLLKQHPDGSYGLEMKNEIFNKLGKLCEPLPYKQDKPLPPPIVHSKKKRGGKRARKLKEMTAMTAVRRQQNRIAFGSVAEDEVVVGEDVVGAGLLASTSTRILKADPKLRERVKKQSERALTGIYGKKPTEIKNPFAFSADTALILKKNL